MKQSQVWVLVLSLVGVAFAQVTRVKLGYSGPEVSSIIYGTLHLAETGDANAALARIVQCLQVGITTFDLADVYAGGKALALFGQALALKPSIRSQIQVIAKMDIGQGAYLDTSVDHLTSVVNLYLKTLNTDYLDVVLFHWPDPLLNITEVVPLFTSLLKKGTVKSLGVSNFSPYQRDYLKFAFGEQIFLVTNEIEVSVLNPQALSNGLIDYMAGEDAPVLAWGSIGGDPFGGYNRLFYSDDNRIRQLRGFLENLASQMNTTMDVLALAWLLRIPRSIIPIIGTTNLERIVNQTLAPTIATQMTRQQWWQIAVASGVPLFGAYSPLP